MRTHVKLGALLVLFSAGILQAEDKKPIEPFNGRNLNGWKVKDSKVKSYWVVGKAEMSEKNPRQLSVTSTPTNGELVNNKTQGQGVDISTEAEFGDCTIELEVMVPKGSNSGIYVMGEYEVQILDSYGKKQLGQGDMGAIYSAAKPPVNASKKPGEWQKFVIEFQAPRFEGDKKVKNANFVKLTLNGKTLHENVQVQKATPGGLTGKEAATGPLMFQGNHGPVAFRNIKITPR